MATIKWNSRLKFILTDVDETIADVYMPAEPGMIRELTKLLEEGLIIFFVTGGGLQRVRDGIIDFIPAELRHNTLVSHSTGAEVWGFTKNGDREDAPEYSLYDATVSPSQKKLWRELIKDIVSTFHLETHPAMPVNVFRNTVGSDPLQVMLDDRGPQITFEFVNGFELTPEQEQQLEVTVPLIKGRYDLRIPVLEYAEKLFGKYHLPITPTLGGVFALNFQLQGISKTTSVKHAIEDQILLKKLGLPTDITHHPEMIEIWGDKFSSNSGNNDFGMSSALDPTVRSISFRDEDPEEFHKEYNIVLWNGTKRLHHGVLEYIHSRHST